MANKILLETAVSRFVKLTKEIEPIKAELEKLAEQIKAEATEKEYTTTKGILQIIETAETFIFDTTAFRKENPELANKYKKLKSGYKTLKVK